MVYGYIRVSTDKQSVENQDFEIKDFCKKNDLVVKKFVEESISGKKPLDERELGNILKKMKKGDMIICTELSRLGRSLLMIMGVLNECMNRGVKVWTIRDNYRLGDDISCKVLAFTFGLAAEVEGQLISQRTRSALNRKKDEGVILGRPVGSKSTERKLSGKENEIKTLLRKKISKAAIARIYNVAPSTVSLFVKEKLGKEFQSKRKKKKSK